MCAQLKGRHPSTLRCPTSTAPEQSEKSVGTDFRDQLISNKHHGLVTKSIRMASVSFGKGFGAPLYGARNEWMSPLAEFIPFLGQNIPSNSRSADSIFSYAGRTFKLHGYSILRVEICNSKLRHACNGTETARHALDLERRALALPSEVPSAACTQGLGVPANNSFRREPSPKAHSQSVC